MNGVKNIIAKRRSIRKYRNREIPNNLIWEVIDAARMAPSGCNAQPTRFYIIKDEKTKDNLRKNKVFKQDFVLSAPVIILYCGDPSAYPKEKLESGFDDSYKTRAIRDVSIASQNLVLRATDLGLGTCYVGWVNKPKIRKILGIDKRFVSPFAITLGYPAEKPKARPRKKIKEIMLGYFEI